MKTTLLIGLFLGIFSVNAQTTHNLDWFTGIGSNVDLTIEIGDTVIWTWTDPNHTVENVPGSSVETFNSGFLGPTGSTYSYTFTIEGDNDYFCGIHGAASMSGTITVQDNLGIDDETIKVFNIKANPVDQILEIRLPITLSDGDLKIYDLLGKVVIIQDISNTDQLQIDVSTLTKGLYLITVASENNIQTKRFIKQ